MKIYLKNSITNEAVEISELAGDNIGDYPEEFWTIEGATPETEKEEEFIKEGSFVLEEIDEEENNFLSY